MIDIRVDIVDSDGVDAELLHEDCIAEAGVGVAEGIGCGAESGGAAGLVALKVC